MAIGAQRADVLQMIVGGGMKLALVGVGDRPGRRALALGRAPDDAVRD